MREGDRFTGGVRIQGGPLNQEATSFLARSKGRSKRRRWVLKWLGAETSLPLRSRLRADIAGLASLSHASLGLPTSFGLCRPEGRAFLLRPYLEGTDLAAASAGRAPAEILPLFISAAEALGLLHRLGFLHGNVKASNLLAVKTPRSRRPRNPRVVLCDPAWWPDADGSSAASDLHSLGAVFYRLLTGSEPKADPSRFPFRPARLNSAVPLDLERAVQKLLHPEPERRYQRAEDLVEDLRRLAGGGAPPPSIPAQCFVDRAGDLDRARGFFEDPARSFALAVAGESGAGKSAFLRRLALEAQLSGFRTVALRSSADLASPRALVRAILEDLLPPRPAGRAIRARFHRLLEAPGVREAGSIAGVSGTRSGHLREVLELARDESAAWPLLLLIDEVEQGDAKTIEFLAEAARAAASPREQCPDGHRPSISLGVAFRNESPFRAKLNPLLEAFRSSGGRSRLLELFPLPGRVIDHRFLPPAESSPPRDPSLAHRDYFQSLGEEERRLLGFLAVLARPAPPALLSRLLEARAGRLRPVLDVLSGDGTLSKDGGRFSFRHGSLRQWLEESLDERERKSLHRCIASALEALSAGPVEEIARHWIHSDAPGKGAPAILAAARKLAGSKEDQEAMVFYRRALNLLEGKPRKIRAEVAWEAAEVSGRAGDHRGAIGILEKLLGESGSRSERGRVNSRLGILRHRAGEPGPAKEHLERGLALLARSRGPEVLRDCLLMESVLAEIASNRGEYAEAEAICRRALKRLAGESEGEETPEVRREEMLLLETWAHVHLRRFQYREARELFERSLKAGERLGPVAEKGLILNNLGTLHVQENRFAAAIRCYREAEELSLKIGDDQSLATVLSNLAVLHAKTGDPEAADEALRRAALHETRCDSRRTRFLLLHSSGLTDLLFGRYASAIRALEAAVEVGLELKDLQMTAFDLVYLGECRLYRGETRSARAAWQRARKLGVPLPEALEAMIDAREAALCALRRETRGARAAATACIGRSRGGIAYLEAWNRVFIGWALRLLGRTGEAAEELEEARDFFESAKVPAGEIHSTLELAAAQADAGHPERAGDRLQGLLERFPPGRGPLQNPMLSARCLAYEARAALDRPAPDHSAAGALLLEAESFLIGRRLRDLEVIVRRLKRRLDFEDADRDPMALRGRTPSPGQAGLLSGSSPSIRVVNDLLRQVAPSALPVLLSGETGTGKELAARAIHQESPRRAGRFVSVNCAAIPEALLEAQLFGYRRGAFTGAEEDRQGLLESAAGGSLLFDEVGEMPLSLQAKILRVLDQGLARPLGAEEEVALDVRYLFSTHRDLRALAEAGGFRRDLLFRIAALEVRLPPLRERLSDLPALVEHFVLSAGGGQPQSVIGPDALRILASHSWPGNIRELKNVVTRLVLTAPGIIGAQEVLRALEQAAPRGLFAPDLLRSRPLPDLLSLLENEYLVQLHAEQGGSLEVMAKSLGISVRALYNRFRRLGIRPGVLKRPPGRPG
jgi:DNA-binding NtrC family response regulator